MLFALVGVLLIAAFLFAPTPSPQMQNAKAAGLDDFQFNTNSNSRPIPEVFGTVEVRGNIMWYGSLQSEAIVQKQKVKKLTGSKTVSQTIGYAYFLGLAYAFCARFDRLIAFKMDGEAQSLAPQNLPPRRGLFRRPRHPQPRPIAPPDPNADSFTINVRTGKNATPGGSRHSHSTITFYKGKSNTPDPLLSHHTGYSIAYKEIAYFCFHGFIGDNVRSAPNYSVVVRRTHIEGVGDTDINGDANPAWILWYILTHMTGYSPSLISRESFERAASTLYSERLGMSFVMSGERECVEWCKEILRTIDGVLYIAPDNGLITLKLLRGDYALGACLKINESNSANVIFTRKSFEELITKLTLKYTEQGTTNAGGITGHNTALKGILGYEKSESIEFMGITSSAVAKALLRRTLKKLSYPLATLKFEAPSHLLPLIRVGDVVLFSNEALELQNLPLRILSVSGDKEDSERIEIEGSEDIFALGSMSLQVEEMPPPPAISYEIAVPTRVGAIPYLLDDDPSVIPLAIPPRGVVSSVSVSERGSSQRSTEIVPFSGGYTSPFSIKAERIELYLGEGDFIQEEEISQEAWQVSPRIIIIDQEIIGFGKCAKSERGYTLTHLARGLYGSTPSYHGSSFGFISPLALEELATLELGAHQTTLEFVARNHVRASEPRSLSYTHTPALPLPPSNLKGVRENGSLTLSWVGALRGAGAREESCDSLVAGEDEALELGEFLIEFSGGSLRTKAMSLTLQAPYARGYSVSLVAGIYTSPTAYIYI